MIFLPDPLVYVNVLECMKRELFTGFFFECSTDNRKKSFLVFCRNPVCECAWSIHTVLLLIDFILQLLSNASGMVLLITAWI